jgi:hypothetical protein
VKVSRHFITTRLSVVILFAHSLYATDANGVIDPSEHRAAIRAKLLELTPSGEPLTQVVAVLNEKFATSNHPSPIKVDLIPSSEQTRTKIIRVNLGEYIESPLMLMLPTPIPVIVDTSATWTFDTNDRLVDIAVRKKQTSEFDGN